MLKPISLTLLFFLCPLFAGEPDPSSSKSAPAAPQSGTVPPPIILDEAAQRAADLERQAQQLLATRKAQAQAALQTGKGSKIR